MSLFLDSDMLMLDDVAKLFALFDDRYAVQCVQHDYTPISDTKFLGNKQVAYPRKNWSSMMLFNNEKCRELTPNRVKEANAAYLHRMYWAEDNIGSIPICWNYLVGEYPVVDESKLSLLHWTLGAPCFEAYQHADYSDLWFAELEAMQYAHNPTIAQEARHAAN